MRRLHIDIETYSPVDLRTSGVYKYAEHEDFEILILCYAFDDEDVVSVRMALGEKPQKEFIEALTDAGIRKYAHNALFERTCMAQYDYIIPINQIECTAVKAAYCGLPSSLEAVSSALELGDKSKSLAGKNLIKFFSIPQKGKRNYPKDYLQKFEEYVDYCVQDVIAEREIDHILDKHKVCDFERESYFLDQKINDRGIAVDLAFANAAYQIDEGFKTKAIHKMKEITNLANPNSPKQLIEWLNTAQKDIQVTSIAKDSLQGLLKVATGSVSDILTLRTATSKTSVKKYTAMISAACSDHRIRGCFQFYGANKTGRWAGRIVQLQNLPINKYLVKKGDHDTMDIARKVIAKNDLELAEILYGNKIPVILSELIRASFLAEPGKTFAVSDFSAIEARVLSWLASEQWRMEVFAGHGKIYEAAAAKMFNVDIKLVTKDSEYRMRAKNGELALGYQGGLGAMVRMAGVNTSLTKTDMLDIIAKWRKANPRICKLWNDINTSAIRAVSMKSKVDTGYRGVSFESDGKIMRMNLPSGRFITYYDVRLYENKFGSMAIKYKNIDQITKKWSDTDTYGGKLVENAVQAISRDILVYSMMNLDKAGFEINMHVHDEVITEVDEDIADDKLVEMENIMKQPIPWAPDLILGAEGYITKYYKKD